MDRRGFFKVMLTVPLFTPLLLTTSNRKGCLDVYMISEEPDLFLPQLLKEFSGVLNSDQNFALQNSHPRGNNLRRNLSAAGWNCVENPMQADLTISFLQLRESSLPSFTLVQGGKVCDLRTRKAHWLWNEMNRNPLPSSWLTHASLQNNQNKLGRGEFVCVYKEGDVLDRLSLKTSPYRSYFGKKGEITVTIKEGKAWISESSCKHKICLSSPPIALAGERIICAPNHFFLEIPGASSTDTSIG